MLQREERLMRKRRTSQPQTVSRALAFPLHALLVLDTRDALPLPALSQRDGRVWWHIERTEPEAWAAVRTYRAIRQAHPEWYATIRGTAVLRLDTPTELREMAAQITPAPDGVCYGLQYRQRHDEWTAQFVGWEAMQQYQRAMG
jgi:hypothetical protein